MWKYIQSPTTGTLRAYTPTTLDNLKEIWEGPAAPIDKLQETVHMGIEHAMKNTINIDTDTIERHLDNTQSFSFKQFAGSFFAPHTGNQPLTPSGQLGKDANALTVGLLGMIGGKDGELEREAMVQFDRTATTEGVKSFPEFENKPITQKVVQQYQKLYDQTYHDYLSKITSGEIKIGNSPSMQVKLGQLVDSAVRIRFKNWLRENNLNNDVLVNRWLRDVAGTGKYRIPDIRIPAEKTIIDGTIGNKTELTQQVIDFKNYSEGDDVVIVKPHVGPKFY